MSYSPPRYRKVLGRAALVLATPMALLAIIHSPNEYQATLGISAVACDGPLATYILSVPALLIYGFGLFIAFRYRAEKGNGWIAIACLAICLAVIANVGRAAIEDQRQAKDCR